jgi:hypothetical protein
MPKKVGSSRSVDAVAIRTGAPAIADIQPANRRPSAGLRRFYSFSHELLLWSFPFAPVGGWNRTDGEPRPEVHEK